MHVLLMEQMLGRPLREDEVVHHINEDKFDNRPENLEVMTRGELSSLHRRGQRASPETVAKLSRSHRGRANPRRALTEEQVKEVAEKIIAGCSLRVLAEEYGVSLTTICNIRDGKTCRDWLREYPDEAFPLAEVKKIIKPNAVRRFSIEELTDIRIRLLQQESVNSIAKRYGVRGSTVMNIRDRKTYQDIP